MEEIKVQVVFTEETQYGTFRDAIYYTLDEYNNLDLKAHENLKQERIDNFISAIENQVMPVEYTKEELQAQLNELEQAKLDYINSIDSQIAEKQDKIIELDGAPIKVK